MQGSLTRSETQLLSAALALLALAVLGPHVPQWAHYHAFADQRMLLGVPCALDVLSNLAFALMGLWGLLRLRRNRGQQPRAAQRALAQLFFVALVVTALCSGLYHLHPNNDSLSLDRLGMVGAFAALLGLAVADRVSPRAGMCTAAAVLACGPLSVLAWVSTGNLLPWAALQGAGMILLVWLALRRPADRAWGLSLWPVLGWYALAKGLELGDHTVFALTQGLVSGHTLKHVAAALAAWPLLALMASPTSAPAALMHNGRRSGAGNAQALRA